MGAALPDASTFLSVLFPLVAVVLGLAAAVLLFLWLRRWGVGQYLAQREEYRWAAPVFSTHRPAAPTQHDIIVIGSGIGGLTAGALLAQRGLKVAVFEQHFLAGGFCTSWERIVRRGSERWRYVFDAGVHDISGLGDRGSVRNVLRRLGVEDRLDWRRVGHEYHLPGSHIKIPEGADGFADALAEKFPAERAAIRAFFTRMRAVYREMYADVEKTGGVPRPPDNVDDLIAWPGAHPHAFRWMHVPFNKMLNRHFRSARLKEFLSVLTGYLGDDARALTVGAMAPIFGYYFDGGYYPAGGTQELADVLVGVIEEHGGRVHLRAPVGRILIGQQRATGVELANGEQHGAHAVISNADMRRTFFDLVGREHLPADFAARVEGSQASTSAFMVFLGVDFVPDIEPLVTVRADENSFVAICTPSRVDASLAPPGHSSIALITLIPQGEAPSWDRRAPDYRARKRARGDAMIELAERVVPGLRGRIVFREDGSPATMGRYAWTSAGSIYGPAQGQWHPQMKTPLERLYVAGANTFCGGIEAVMISGALTADAISPTSPRNTKPKLFEESLNVPLPAGSNLSVKAAIRATADQFLLFF